MTKEHMLKQQCRASDLWMKIRSMRRRLKSYKKIAEELGMTEEQVKYFYKKH